MKTQHKKEDVLIVGAGPAGLTLACYLAKEGIRSRIIDKRDGSSVIPRAMNISNTTLDVFKNIGISEKFWEEGEKLDELVIYWNKKRLINIDYKFVKTPYPYFFHLEQSRVETYLNDILRQHLIQVEREVTLRDLIQNKNSVTVTLQDKTGQLEKSHYAHVIGCDGGMSTVRDLIDISCQQENYSSYFVLMDAEIENNFEHSMLHYYLNEEGYLIVVPLPDNKYRLIASFKGDYPGKDNLDLSHAFFQHILDSRGPGHLKIKNSIWTTSAGFYHKLAEDAQKGRVFLAGDALHLFSPVGGTNMNIGIQDAFSLAKKLVSVKKGINPERHLETYREERLRAVSKVKNVTSSATYLVTKAKDVGVDAQKYLPKMKNRKFIKIDLPRLFSGVDFI